MKRFQILIFIFGTIAMLGAICVLFPQDGISCGRMSLRFPSLSEILKDGNSAPIMSPEELIESRRKAVHAARKSEMKKFLASDPARFYLPGDDLSFFDTVFDAFENADSNPVRVVHYGDSQIEEDRITSNIRAALQERFGGSGPGMMPVFKHFTPRVGADCSPELERYMVFANRAEGNRYGPYGSFVRLDTTVTASYFPVRSKDKGQIVFDRVTLLAGNVSGQLTVSGGGGIRTAVSGQALSFLKFDLPDSSTRASLSISGHADLYGVLLDSKTGVRVDNVPMRGCDGAVFTRMNSEQIRTFCSRENVKLILLQYGGNSVPYLSTEKSISSYCRSVRNQIVFLSKNAPRARIVFIGPSDMSTVIKGKRQSYPMLGSVVDSLRNTALSAGAAYWDIRGAMGGDNSMAAWVSAKPALAGPDYIHFTLAGSTNVGEMFSNSLLLYHDYYKLEKKNADR